MRVGMCADMWTDTCTDVRVDVCVDVLRKKNAEKNTFGLYLVVVRLGLGPDLERRRVPLAPAVPVASVKKYKKIRI